jgi:hypothetical protein
MTTRRCSPSPPSPSSLGASPTGRLQAQQREGLGLPLAANPLNRRELPAAFQALGAAAVAQLPIGRRWLAQWRDDAERLAAGRHGYGSRCASSSSGAARSINCRSEKAEIESALFVTLRDLSSLRVDLVSYDITSTYFEGKGPRAHGPAPIRTFPQRCDDSLLRSRHVFPRRVCARQACRPCWRRLRAHAI